MLSHLFFFFTDTATTEIYTLSLHDALPISLMKSELPRQRPCGENAFAVSEQLDVVVRGARLRRPSKDRRPCGSRDRKSTRLNSSHSSISYAVFCLKKKKKKNTT